MTQQDTGSADRYPGTPRWVKLSALAVVLLVALFAGLHLAGIGMGPGMHTIPMGH